MHQAHSPLWLADSRVADIVAGSLRFWDNKRYKLFAYSIMPNHVHAVLSSLASEEGYYSLAKILYTIKRFTATRANLALCRSGTFWQHESYDHVVRDESELLRVVKYVVNNPVKAGLVSQPDQWPWSYWKL